MPPSALAARTHAELHCATTLQEYKGSEEEEEDEGKDDDQKELKGVEGGRPAKARRLAAAAAQALEG